MPLDLSGSAGCLCGTPTEVTWWLSARVAYLSAQKQSEPSPEYIYIYQLHKLLHFSWVACPNHQLLGIHKFIKFLGCLRGVGEPQYVFQTPNVFCCKKKRFSSLAAPSYVLSRKKRLGFFHLWWQIFQWFIQFSGFAISSCPPYQTSQKQVEGALTIMDGGNSDKFHHLRFKGWPNGGNVSLVAIICPKAGSLEIWEPQRLSESLDTWSSFPSSSEHLSARPLEANHSKFSKAITFCWGAWFFGLKEGKGGKWCENKNMCRVGWMALEKQVTFWQLIYIKVKDHETLGWNDIENRRRLVLGKQNP